MDIDTLLGRIPLKGNVGVRWVRTDTTTTGLFQPFRIDNDPNNNDLGTIVILDPNIATTDIDNTYDNVLPSLNLSAELVSDLFLRFAAGPSVTRPTFLQMAPGLSGINPTQRFASSGNPKLQAHEKRGFSARLSYSDRSSYVLLSSDVFGNELVASPYGQLDGSVSYAYDDHWTIFANAINLTGEAAKIYSDTPTQRLSYSHVGRRFEVGLKARF